MGYIIIDRNILEWEWYSDINTYRLFTHMLYKANWKTGNFKGETIPRGSFVSSVRKLSEETSLSEREVRTAISHLKSTGEVTSKSNTKYSVFTVVNYCKFQDGDTQIDKQPTNNRHSIDIQTTTIEEGNKGIKKEVNNTNVLSAECLDEICEMYNSICVSFPRLVKMSEERKRAVRARLKIYSTDDFKRMFELAERSAFLKGGNDRNWSANFDWMIKDKNMIKILEGQYESKVSTVKKNSFNNFQSRNYDTDSLEQALLNSNHREM